MYKSGYTLTEKGVTHKLIVTIMKNSTAVWVIVAILVIAGLGWYLYMHGTTAPYTQTSSTQTSGSTAPNANPGVPSSVTVTYTDQGFSPAVVTIVHGGSITWINHSTGDLWVASDPHPVHSGYDGTSLQQHCAAGASASFDSCGASNSYTFTFDKIGSWGYHNHANHAMTGTVVVQQ